MNTPPPRPDWRLPAGVTRGVWEYAHAESIADDYDAYFAGDTLFEFDEALLNRHFQQPGVLIDLGCGTGRLLFPFVRRGFTGVAVDLSAPMLRVVGEKSRKLQLPVHRVQANLIELECLADGTADYAICMFSTLGMIRGREHRLAALRHMARILRPGGLLVLHVHNRWYNFRNPLSRGWFLRNQLAAWLGRAEAGDRYYSYRGVHNFFLHVFTKRELRRDLAESGFRIVEWNPLDPARRHRLRWPWLGEGWRAIGWIVVCRTPRSPQRNQAADEAAEEAAEQPSR